MPKNDEKLRKACHRYAAEECTNNREGFCLPQDVPCFAYVSGAGVCTYFLNAVLPGNEVLENDVRQALATDEHAESRQTRNCAMCGEPFLPTSNRQRFCTACGRENERRGNAQRAHEFRARH